MLSGFSHDDREVLTDNPVVAGDVPWTRAFAIDYWDHNAPAGHYRPLASLTLRIDRALWGERAAGYHATNVLLHVLVVALAGGILLRSGLRTPLPWLGLTVFAIHPALADSVAWLSGRTSMVSALGGLAAGWVLAGVLARGSARGAALLLVAATCTSCGVLAALLGKEDGFVFAPLLFLLGLRHSRRAALACALGAATGITIYALMRHAAYCLERLLLRYDPDAETDGRVVVLTDDKSPSDRLADEELGLFVREEGGK